MIAQLHERKFEIDSLANVIRLQNVYYERTHDATVFDFSYFRALGKMIGVFRTMQADNGE